LAARRAGADIELDVVADCLRTIEAAHDVTLVEGAGGLLVPITRDHTYADLARRLDLALVVVVGSKLGCINHCLLTMRHAEHVGLPVAGYILNQVCPDQDLATQTNGELLRELIGPPLGSVPYGADSTTRLALDGLLLPP
jgi:dethiobiotin synthetase